MTQLKLIPFAIIVALLLMVVKECTSQSFVVTPDGLRDSANTINSFIVIEAPGLTAEQLYNNTIKMINKMYKNPNEVITGNLENEMIKFQTFQGAMFKYPNGYLKVWIDAKFVTEITFKDGKAKFEIVDLDMYNSNDRKYHVLFSGAALSGYIVYNNKGKLVKESAKEDIENYFNSFVASMVPKLKGDTKDDW